MRKREVNSKPGKLKPATNGTKKGLSKTKNKPKHEKTQEYFILLGDQFYVASSKTERKTYCLFEEKVKAAPPTTSTTPQFTGMNSNENIDLRQYVKSLSKQEKQQLFHDLERDIDIQKEEQASITEEKNQDKLDKLQIKLENVKNELMHGWEQQINKINHLFDNEQISLEQKNSKIRLVEKIRNNKLAMIDYTRVLFEKIMKEDNQQEYNKQEQLQQIINSLNSASSLGHQQDMQNSLEIPLQADLPSITANEIQQQKLINNLNNDSKQEFMPQIKEVPLIESIQQKEQLTVFTKQTLKLEIRLDQVEFGRDHYDEENQNSKTKQQKQFINIEENSEKDIQINHDKVIEISSPIAEQKQKQNQIKSAADKKKLEEQFLCVDQQSDLKIKIPLLMTKDRLEQLEIQKSSKQIETLNNAIKNRQAFQVSEIPPDNVDHFTTLLDVNNFVVSFYEFVMQRFLKEVIEGLNLAFGKAALDKLFQIRNEGYVPDHENNNILPEELLSQYHKQVNQPLDQITVSVRKIPQHEKLHNKAVFHAFNAGLNVYRPYYELEGEVFPWNTSEKGLTFYQINEDNIEEVFQKSKMKVLQYCASLCGIMPGCQLTTDQSAKMLQKRNEDSFERVHKAEINQKFGDWYLKMLNFEALVRLNLCDQIIEQQIWLAISDIQNIIL